VFPGSYLLIAFSQVEEEKRVGAWQRVEVSDKSVDVVLELKHAMELSGKVEIESTGNPNIKIMPNQINLQLNAQPQMFFPGSQTQVNDDGTFTMKGVLPGPWLLHANVPFGYMKAVWMGSTDVTAAPMDLSGGAAGPLKIVVSTNTATIRGSAPAGQMVMVQRSDLVGPFRGNMATTTDQNGQYTFGGLAPGKYRLMLTDAGGPMPDEGGQEVAVREGETVTADLKAQ
jgi:hypothetical protein